MGFLDNLCSEDSETANDAMYHDCSFWLRISCLYPKLNTLKWRIFNIVYYIFLNCLVIYYIGVFSNLAAICNAKMSLVFEYVHLAILGTILEVALWYFNYYRRNVSSLFNGYGPACSNYDDNTEHLRTGLNNRLEKDKKIFVKIIIAFFCPLPFWFLIIAPLVNTYFQKDVKNRCDVSHSIPYILWIPPTFQTDIDKDFLAISLQIIVVTSSPIIMASGVMFYITRTLRHILELKLLLSSIRKLPQRTLYLYNLRHGNRDVDITRIKDDPALSSCYSECLKQNVRHHQVILRLFNDMNTVMGVPLLWLFIVVTCLIALSSAMIIFTDDIGSILIAIIFCLGEIINIYFICWCGAQYIHYSSKIPLALYSTNWMCTTKSDILTLQIFMCKAQQYQTLKAGFLYPVNYETFTKIMNTAYGYFNLLYALK